MQSDQLYSFSDYEYRFKVRNYNHKRLAPVRVKVLVLKKIGCTILNLKNKKYLTLKNKKIASSSRKKKRKSLALINPGFLP